MAPPSLPACSTIRSPPRLDPLSPEAPLLFLNGPLSGTAGPATGRFVVCARSPLTGLWGELNCGGFWGPELRMAGFDGLWVEGRSEKPVYLWIQDGKVEIRPAEHLWGMDTYQTQSAIESELNAGKVRVSSIGIAGESRHPVRADPVRPRARQRAHRHGRGDGQQAPQGGRRPGARQGPVG